MKAPKGYVSLLRLARAMGLGEDTLYAHEGKEDLPIVYINDLRYVSMQDACRLVKVWRRSCTPREATKLVPGLSDGSVTYFMKKGKISFVTVFGRRRPLRKSLDSIREYLSGREVLIEKPGKRGFFAQLSREAIRAISSKGVKRPFTSDEAREAQRKQAKLRAEKYRAKNEFISVAEAAEILTFGQQGWKASLFLRQYLADHGRRKDGEEFYLRGEVEKFAKENPNLLYRIRTSKTGW